MPDRDKCIFCAIAEHAAPADILFEDDEVLAFRDINPVAPVHVLVIPKTHISTLNGTTDHAILGKLVAVGRDMAAQLGVATSGYRTLINCERDGGQVVFHLHLHVIGGRKLGPMA